MVLQEKFKFIECYVPPSAFPNVKDVSFVEAIDVVCPIIIYILNFMIYVYQLPMV